MKFYKNEVLSDEHSVATGDIFYTHLHRFLKKPDDMTSKAFKACFEVHMKQYEYLKADYELRIGDKEISLFSFNSFSV